MDMDAPFNFQGIRPFPLPYFSKVPNEKEQNNCFPQAKEDRRTNLLLSCPCTSLCWIAAPAKCSSSSTDWKYHSRQD